VLLLSVASAILALSADSTSRAPRTLPELEQRILRVLDSTHTPGASVALVTRDSALWVTGLGFADVARRRQATARTLFRIGSTSKSVTALVILQLVREGKLSLDDPLRERAPEIAFDNRWEATDPVRIVNLLEHTTGFDDFALRDYASSDSTPLILRQGLDFTPATRRSRWRPGTRVSYCNSGPGLAAYVAEKIDGQPFEAIAQRRVFDPIGMRTATYLLSPAMRAEGATLYRDDGITPVPYWHVLQRPAGSINASAEDMARYLRFLIGQGTIDGAQLVPAGLIERMALPHSSLSARAGLPVGYGLFLGSYVDSGFVWVGHNGGVNGGLSMFAYLPSAGRGFYFAINSGSIAAYKALHSLLRDYLVRDLTRPALPPAAPMSAQARARWTGWFRSDNPRNQKLYGVERVLSLTRVTADDSTLVVRSVLDDDARYVPVSERLFRQSSEPVPTLALVEDAANGRPVAIERVGYLLPRELVRVPSTIAWLELGVVFAFVLALIATLVFALIWVPRLVFRRLRGERQLRVRALPLLGALAIGAHVVILIGAAGDPIARLGAPTAWSVSLWVLSVSFALVSVLALFTALRADRSAMRRGVWWLSVFASATFTVVAAYLAYWGLIGWRTWA
jgi:CubicO group peptidase (beta-lactamase class C family)